MSVIVVRPPKAAMVVTKRSQSVVVVKKPSDAVIVVRPQPKSVVVVRPVASAVVVAKKVSPSVLVTGVRGPSGSMGQQGAQGPPGPPGQDGSGVQSYRHVQAMASSSWTVEHNLGFFPNVVIVDSTRSTVEGEIVYVDINTLIVNFTAPFGGEAYLS